MQINFISSINDSDETRTKRTKSHNVEIMMGSETDEIINQCFESLLQNFQKDLEELLRGSELSFDNVDLLYYHLQKSSLKRMGPSYIDSLEWLKNKKSNNKSKK